MSEQVLVVDAGTGNLRSVVGALTKIGSSTRVSCQAEDVLKADRVILPGVGAFGEFMQGLSRKNLTDALREFIQLGRPLLGICFGMQALMEISEEFGYYQGLGIFGGRVVRFAESSTWKVPHTGWNQVWLQQHSRLTVGLSSGFYAYFNHSYFCEPARNDAVLATTDYVNDFCSIIGEGTLFGVQFHPEKSQMVGEILLKNFIKI